MFTYGSVTTRNGCKSKSIENIFDTTTPGSALLFWKDMEHAGNVLKKGNKHIVTANIWATRANESKQVLLVIYPLQLDETKDTSSAVGETKSNAATRAMHQAVDGNKSYALPVEILRGMLKTHVQWVNRQSVEDECESPPVVTYQCTNFDYVAFGVVYNVLNRPYVSEDDIIDHQECLDFFGPFAPQNLLVDLQKVLKL